MIENKSDNQFDVRNPRSGQIDYHFSAPDDDEIKTSTDALRAAQVAWAANTVTQRITVLQRWQDALENEKAAIVDALALDTGRRALAEQELDGLIHSIDRWCSIAPELLENYRQPAAAMPDVEIYGDSAPYPLLGAISPWNFPLLLSFIDVTPALLAGCAAIIKPSEVTPRFVEPVVKSIAQVPELAQVLVIKPGGSATGQAIIKHVDVVAFTGSVATGKKVALAAAEAFIPAFLELGGKDPVIVLEGSDIDRATTAILRASIAATGQACQSLERIYVARSEYPAFCEMLTDKAQQVALSKPGLEKGNVGPLIFAL